MTTRFPAHDPKSRCRLQRIALGALLALMLGACTPEPPMELVNLTISDSGEYAVDGVAIDKAHLAEVLKARQRPGQKLVVHLQPNPKASYDAVHAAMAACQQVGANVGMVGNEQFLPANGASGSSS